MEGTGGVLQGPEPWSSTYTYGGYRWRATGPGALAKHFSCKRYRRRATEPGGLVEHAPCRGYGWLLQDLEPRWSTRYAEGVGGMLQSLESRWSTRLYKSCGWFGRDGDVAPPCHGPDLLRLCPPGSCLTSYYLSDYGWRSALLPLGIWSRWEA